MSSVGPLRVLIVATVLAACDSSLDEGVAYPTSVYDTRYLLDKVVDRRGSFRGFLSHTSEGVWLFNSQEHALYEIYTDALGILMDEQITWEALATCLDSYVHVFGVVRHDRQNGVYLGSIESVQILTPLEHTIEMERCY